MVLEECTVMPDAGIRQLIERIGGAVRRMDRLITDMLQLSRVSRQELAKTTVNLSNLAEEAVAELRRQQPERSVDIVIAPEVRAWGDPHLLRLVMENLLNNAWKFTAKVTGATIEFGVTDEGGELTFFVRDNGVGFDMAYVDKLFAPFQRLHAETDYAGVGIGLAIVQRVVHRHGGTVRGDGVEGAGATLYFTLPPADAIDPS
jgi:signal transduction histidine kinase